ncbi:MAG: enoyl-CoA hydratase/isomerase family protein [Bacteroidales bacterium]|nr:enoyl-CoA hydratase/isomerase family protein [Bacteroidales bacterium]
MLMKFLISEIENGIAVLKISRPQALNALNTEVLAELEEYIDNIPSDIRVLIITGDGPKSFVAGADIAEMSNLTPEGGLEFGRRGARVFKKIEDLDIPVIAAINGFALGGGCEIAMACDIRIAAENAKFGQPEVGLGIIPGFSGTYRLAKLVGQGMAKDLIFSGRTIRADEALRIGLVNQVVKSEELMDVAKDLASKIAQNAPIAVKYAKQCINQNYDMERDTALAFENEMFAKCFATEDQKNGMNAFLKKEKVIFINK